MPTERFILPGMTADTSESWEIDDKGNISIRRTQKAEHVVDALNTLRAEGAGRRALGGAGRYVGSVPLVLAAEWAKECGAAIGTKEFLAYCRRKLQDHDNAKLLVNRF